MQKSTMRRRSLARTVPIVSDWSDLRYERVLWLAAPADMFARRRVRVVWDFLRGVVATEPELFGPGNR
jgi:hypothetical protein